MMGRLLLVVVFATAACGKVNDPGAIDASGGGDGAPAVDAAPDACVPGVRISVQFMITKIVGTGSSTLDVMLNHPNGFIVTLPTWTEERGIDSFPGGPSDFKTAIKGTYAMDYTGQDGTFLDTEMGQFLSVGGAFRQSVIDLSDSKSIFLYVLPTQTSAHPYMDTRCNNAPFMTDGSNFPVLKSFTATNCSVTFFDFRPGVQRNVIAEQNSTLELTYQSCP